MNEMWDNRYASATYAYGTAPNRFFKDTLDHLHLRGKILMPAEGEGRNAVYAAKRGLEVTAFDISEEGKKKAVKLAAKEQVSIRYEIGDFLEMDFKKEDYDAAGLIYAHFMPLLLPVYHKKISDLIKPNGIVILEGFSTSHLSYQKQYPEVGGPKNAKMLFSTELIQKHFSAFEIIQLNEVEVDLEEGEFHNGKGSVIRFIGRKR